jgi:tRNA/tmRNA/rRNA uracil-C5-methylase (TrmA/RlmC/RlmD family)
MQTTVDVDVERAVAGGRMLGRVDGQVVLIAGAIPGERVRARVERSTANVAWATVVEVLTPSADRRTLTVDPSCGGLSYAHVEYERQRVLKGEVVADAFRRIGKISLDAPVTVRASPERGYRMRARLHVKDGQVGFYREHSHDICDAAATAQLQPGAVDVVEDLLRGLGGHGQRIQSVVIGEAVTGGQRLLHLEPHSDMAFDAPIVAAAVPAGVLGVSSWFEGRVAKLSGEDRLVDKASDLFTGTMPVPAETRWRRSAASFFQGNRFLLGDLVGHVLAAVRGDVVADLYAGVGLFAVAAAAAGARVLAVEGDRTSSADLAINAEPYSQFETHRASVEQAAKRLRPGAFTTIVIDPPRTGMSKEAMDAVLRLAAQRLVYVSCDPATLARDAAKILAGGYDLASLDGFDLFPTTGHVETVGIFDRRAGR